MTPEHKAILKELQTLPGIGPNIAEDLYLIGVHSVRAVAQADPEELYTKHNARVGRVEDRCLLYTFYCAQYCASTPEGKWVESKTKWWNWKYV